MVIIKVQAISLKDERTITPTSVVVDNIRAIHPDEYNYNHTILIFDNSFWIKVNEKYEALINRIDYYNKKGLYGNRISYI